jgi:hypothetical protein
MPRLNPAHARIAKEIAKKYGSVIDLNKSPSVIIEIIRNYRFIFGGLDDPGDVTVSGGTGGGTSSIAVAGTSPPQIFDPEQVELFRSLTNSILALHRDVKAIAKDVKRLTPAR